MPSGRRAREGPLRFSIVIPAHNEEKYLPRCLASIAAAASPYPGEVEVIVALNRCTDGTEAVARAAGARTVVEDARNMAAIRNAGARAATGEFLLTIDADSAMSPNMLETVDRALSSGRYVGGGVAILPERWSLGITASALLLLPIVLVYRITGGLFWLRREDFVAIGGFDEGFVSAEDVDFARRLKAHGKRKGMRFGHVFSAHIVTSCRKWDQFGDWFMVTHPRFAWRIFTGRDREAADKLYYDAER
jgi:glycosyltransferase involved in cell wall biosynthesis